MINLRKQRYWICVLLLIIILEGCAVSDAGLKIDKKASGYAFLKSQIEDIDQLQNVRIRYIDLGAHLGGYNIYLIPRTEQQQLFLDILLNADYSGAEGVDRIVVGSLQVYLEMPDGYYIIRCGHSSSDLNDGAPDGIVIEAIMGDATDPSSVRDTTTRYFKLDPGTFSYDPDEVLELYESIAKDNSDEKYTAIVYHIDDEENKVKLQKSSSFPLQILLDNNLKNRGDDGVDRADKYDMAFEFCGVKYLIDSTDGYYSRTENGKTKFSQIDIEPRPEFNMLIPGFFPAAY